MDFRHQLNITTRGFAVLSDLADMIRDTFSPIVDEMKDFTEKEVTDIKDFISKMEIRYMKMFEGGYIELHKSFHKRKLRKSILEQELAHEEAKMEDGEFFSDNETYTLAEDKANEKRQKLYLIESEIEQVGVILKEIEESANGIEILYKKHGREHFEIATTKSIDRIQNDIKSKFTKELEQLGPLMEILKMTKRTTNWVQWAARDEIEDEPRIATFGKA
eukprot:TRINITY_DN191_c0_g1_i3.p1 TRINITY_DN191_c0_g1~~TRINITY_DN191_c0_g1_i3.p1  ORF type:complete len:219 (-),score=64.72 TRINITY_DN191_c0_g1_i3:124-780(-)